ncbi:MAG: hypothetical protein A4S17_10810 [Proteobacteria bacterium HN_bin10]|nr:MAG: hypothetical protein A4S17_10810 [Proteobacteria bacterium HN_bin10]
MIKRGVLLVLALLCFAWAAWSAFRMVFTANEYEFREWVVSIGLELGLGILLLSWARERSQ